MVIRKESISFLEEYFRHFVTASQKNWVDLIHAAQLCYNLHRISLTGMSPFKIVARLQPRAPLEVAK